MTVTAARLAEVFVEVADTLDEEYNLGEFLHLVTVRAAEVAQSDAAGLLLADADDRLQFVVGSDETAGLLELFQMQHREGPCLDCFRTGAPVLNADLADAADRWPHFAPQAVAAGFHSVHAIPLRRPGTSKVGALNLFTSRPGRLLPDDIYIVQALADLTTIRLLQERAIHGGQVLADQLQTALDSRILIEQAKGAVAQMYQVSVGQAFELMRDHARRNNQPLKEVARIFLADPATVPGLAGPVPRSGG